MKTNKKEEMASNHLNRKFLRLISLSFVICQLSYSLCAAQTLLSQYRPGVTPEGAVYFLPKTALRISVLVEKTTYEPGDFAPYAQRYLRVGGFPGERDRV